MSPAAAVNGDLLAFQILQAVDPGVGTRQQRDAVGVVLPGADRFNRRACGIDEQKGQIAGKADVQRPRIQRLLHRRAGVEGGELQIVRQIIELAGGFQRGEAIPFDVAEPQRHFFSGESGVEAQRQRDAGKQGGETHQALLLTRVSAATFSRVSGSSSRPYSTASFSGSKPRISTLSMPRL